MRDILIVDDDAGNLVAYQAALEPLGRKLVVASSGTDAIARLLEQDFALVLLDVAMPELDGLATARLVKQRPRNERLPIIFITGDTSRTSTILEAYELGAYDFVVKPVLPEVLRAKTRLYLELADRSAAEAESLRKDEFLAMLGHELRNPLAAIVSALELIKLRDAPLGRELRIIDRQLSHLTQMVNDLVDVAHVTRGAIVLRREAIGLARVIADAIALARPVLDQHAHELEVTVADDVLVDADGERLAQVLANLVTNAAKYTPGRGRIEISAEVVGTFARIRVRDNGMGIPQPLLSTLFEPFVQGERSIDRHLGGLGIGLTLVRALVYLHGGTVSADSAGAGTGATITIHWPLASSKTPTAEMAPLERSNDAKRVLRILVVDDNADAAELLGGLLETLGHEIAVAHDGVAALDRAATFAPDVAFLDIGLPGRDGYAVARDMRALPSCARTVLVALTGYGQPEDRARALDAGFAHHHVKPMDLSHITRLLADVSAEPSGLAADHTCQSS